MNYLSEEIKDKIAKQNFSEEQKKLIEEIFQETNAINGYKIRIGKSYKVIVQTWENYKYYKIPVYAKGPNGEQRQAFKSVRFVGDNIPNLKTGDEIIIKSMFEDFFFLKNDKYHAQFMVVIRDFDFKLNGMTEQRQEEKAIDDFAFDDDFTF